MTEVTEATAVPPQRTVFNLETALSLPQALNAGVVEQKTQSLHVGGYRQRPDRSTGQLLDTEHSEICKHLLFGEKRLLHLLRCQRCSKAEAENDIDRSATPSALQQCALKVALHHEEGTRRNPSAALTEWGDRISAAGAYPVVDAQDGGQRIGDPHIEILHDKLSRLDPDRHGNEQEAERSRGRQRSILPLAINPLLNLIAVVRRTPSTGRCDHDVLSRAILEDGFPENAVNVDPLIARRLKDPSVSTTGSACVCGKRSWKHE